MQQLIFITGFARGGTSWLRDCVAFHPLVGMLPRELTLFRDCGQDRDAVLAAVHASIQEHGVQEPFCVNKAPANAPYTAQAARLLPEAKFLFIIRDPRDVLISHQRGNQEWMGGVNSTVQGCMKKSRIYFQGYQQACGCPNVKLVRYEDLHQDFLRTMAEVYAFLGLEADAALLESCFEQNSFRAATGRQHKEDRNAGARKGVVGDWVRYLSSRDEAWYRDSSFWTEFMREHGYSWHCLGYSDILQALAQAGVRTLGQQDLLRAGLSKEEINLLLLHDIDSLKTAHARESILETARLEGELGLASIFSFLPLDDPRYLPLKPQEVRELIQEVRSRNPYCSVALHINATEPFFPAQMQDVGDDAPDMERAVRYLRQQVEDYAELGIHFRIATAHGYGRGKKLPNNRDSQRLIQELDRMGISSFNSRLSPALYQKSARTVAISDVGDVLSIFGLNSGGAVDRPETFQMLPAGSLVQILTHPGNYDARLPLLLGTRKNAPISVQPQACSQTKADVAAH